MAGPAARRNVSIRRADYWLVEDDNRGRSSLSDAVSIRRADYWLVEEERVRICQGTNRLFQSAGRIIGWLKLRCATLAVLYRQFQSAGRIIGWLKSAHLRIVFVTLSRFNPPGGLLVG